MNIIGSYTWIDNVLIDGMDYFAGMFGYFQDIAWALGALVLFVGLMISAIKLVFGAESIKKVAVGTLGKLCMFIILFYGYRRITGAVSNSALKWGSYSGKGRSTVTANLVGLMDQAEHDLAVANRLTGMDKKAREKEIKKMKQTVKEKKALGQGGNDNFFSDMTSKDGMSVFANQANLYRDPEEVVEYQAQTMETLREVLTPGKIKDKNGNLIDTYFLATTMYDKHGRPTNYISPASFFKISILTGKLIWRRQADYIEIKYGEDVDKHKEAGKIESAMAPVLAFFSVKCDFTNLLNLVLCLICCIAVIACGIFAIIQYMMTMFEYAIVTSIVIFYVPFYLADLSKSIATKLFPIFWNFLIKMMVVTMLMWFAMFQYINLASDQMGMAIPFDLTVFATTMFTILLSFIVTQNGPKVAQTIISGNPELSMGEFLQAGGTMAAGGMLGRKALGGASRVGAGVVGEAVGSGTAYATKAKAAAGGGAKGFFAGAAGFVGGSVIGGIKGARKETNALVGNALFGRNAQGETTGVHFSKAMASGASGVLKELKEKETKTETNNAEHETARQSEKAENTEKFHSENTSSGDKHVNTGEHERNSTTIGKMNTQKENTVKFNNKKNTEEKK